MKGLFITIEGNDGSGKSTVIQSLKEELAKHVLDIDVDHMSGIDNFEAGYIDKELEKIVEEENDKLEEQDAIEEPVEVEEKPKKKAAKKSSKKKEEKVEVVAEPQEELPNMSLANAMQSMGPLVQTDPEWEEAKQEMQDKLKATTIDADATPSTMKILIAEIDDLLCELRLLRTEKNDEVKAIDSMMEYIRLKNSVGSNAEERKAKGYMALANHKKNPGDTESINLIELKLFFESQLNFFNESIEILKDRKQLLVTFNGMQKIEANL